MSNLIYNGVLAKDTIDHIKSAINNGYENWVEMERYPKGFNPEWQDRNLVVRAYKTDDCMGNNYTAQSVMFTVIGRFIGFKSDKELTSFVLAFESDVRKINPFSMSF